MPSKPEQRVNKPLKRPLIRRVSAASGAPPSWRDVTSYFNTLNAETRGLKTLTKQVRAHLKPKDVFERMCCDDIIALSWQAHQLRSIKGYIILAGAQDEVADRVRALSRKDDSEKYQTEADFDIIASMYIRGKPVGEQLSVALASSGMLLKHHFQMGYVARAAELEHIDRLIFVHEKRRDDLIDRFRSGRG